MKKDDQDGSFLIIDESVKAEALPDTAVQLFDAAPANEISFFSEPAASGTESMVTADAEVSTPSEIAFFDGPAIASDEAVISEPVAETESAVLFIEEPAVAEVSAPLLLEEAAVPAQEEKMELSALLTSMETEKEPEIIAETAIVPEKNDIYAPLRKALAEYDSILAAHTQIAEAKDAEIADYNNQVAIAKAAAKKALEERKALETEMDRVRQMKDLFSAQLK